MPADENKVKQTIELDGEKEYKKALDDAYRTLKVLKSELKAETAELGKNATAQEKNAVKMKSLQKQIAEQEKVVKTCTKALEEAREKYSDNEEEIAKWEQKLNNARAALANMKNDLEGVGDGFKAMQTDANMATVATKSAADAIGTLADIGGSISDAIEGIFTGLLSTVKETIADVWADVVDLAARSNGLVDLAGFWNTDLQTIQKYGYAVQAISGTLEDLNSIVNKINTLDPKKVTELTGVSSANYKDQWEYAMAVMDALSKLGDNRNSVTEQLFGKQQTKAYDFLNDWAKMQKELEEVGTKGYGLSDEELSRMSELYDRVNKIRASWQSLKDMATVKLLGELSLDLTSNAQGILDGFLEYFNADDPKEKDAAIQKIEDNIIAMFTRIGDAIKEGIEIINRIAEDMKGSDNPTVQTIGKVMSGLADALKWFTEDNMNNVIKSLEALALFWIAGKGLQMLATIKELTANMKAISFFKTLNGATGSLGNIGGTIGTTAGESFLSVLKAGLPGILGTALIYLGFEWAKNQRNEHPEQVRGTEEHLAAETGTANQLLADYVQAQKEWSETDVVNAAADKVEELQKKIEETRQALLEDENGQKALDAYSDWRQENSMGNMDWELPENMKPVAVVPAYEWEKKPETQRAITDEQMAAVEAFWDVLREKGADFTDEEWDAYEKAFQGQEELFDKIDDMMNYLMQTEDNWRGIEDLPADWWLHGANQGEGITNENLSAFNSLPNKMEKAVAKGVSGIRVEIDGQSAGRILAPYVSEYIAAMM